MPVKHFKVSAWKGECMNKIRWITVSILLLFIINSCSIYKKDVANEINKEGYAVNFI